MTNDLKNVNNQEFLEDFNKINWYESLQIIKNNVNVSNNYLDNIKTLITKHAPIKKSH